MKKPIFTFLSITLVYIFNNCATVKPPPGDDFGTGNCPLEQLEWNSDIVGFDQEKSLKILSDLKAAAQAKQVGIADSVKFNADFTASINNIIKSTNRKEFKVSQEVQDLMVKLRRLGCDMQAGLFDGNKDAAQKKYLELLTQVDDTKKN